MNTLLLILLFAIPPQPVITKPGIVRDRSGRIVQTIRPSQGGHILVTRDNSGRITGTVKQTGTKIIIKNSRGQIK